MNPAADRQAELLDDLRRALRRGQLGAARRIQSELSTGGRLQVLELAAAAGRGR